MAQDLARLFPPGVVQVLTGLGSEVGDALVRHPGIPRIAFIGSAATGRRIQASAASAAVKTVTLELGGKNPLVVFPDADLDLAVEGAIRGMNFAWQGQSCGSTSRLLVHRDRYDDLVAKVGERLASMRPGSPLDPSSGTGAIVTPQQLDKVLSYIEIGKSEQARLVTGGERLTTGDLADGNFVTPALPRPVTYVPPPPGTRTLHLRLADGILLVTNEADNSASEKYLDKATYFGQQLGQDTEGLDEFSAGVRVYDVSDPARPVEAGFLAIPGFGTHRLWWVPTRSACSTTTSRSTRSSGPASWPATNAPGRPSASPPASAPPSRTRTWPGCTRTGRTTSCCTTCSGSASAA
jgi:hypothetical protein